MGRIFRDLTVIGNKGKRDFKNVLLDNGATYSVIRQDLAMELCEITPFFDDQGKKKEAVNVSLPDGRNISATGTCTFQTTIEGRAVRDEAWVVDKLKRGFIIGAHTLQEGKINFIHASKKEGGDRVELGEMDVPEI